MSDDVNSILAPVKKPKAFGRLHSGTPHLEYDRRENVLWLGDKELDGSQIMHELTHFYEHSSTPYGLLYDDLQRAKNFFVRQYLEVCPEVVHIPLYEWCRNFNETDSQEFENEELKRHIKEYISPWSFCEFAESILESDDATIFEGIESKDIKSVFSRTESVLTQLNGDSPIEFPMEMSNGPCISIDWDDQSIEGMAIGVTHISEGLAQVTEGLNGNNVDALPDRYKILPLLVLQAINDDIDSSIRSRVAAITYVTIADLALFTPLGGRYPEFRHRQTDWYDLHPGHRFIKALTTVAEKNIWIDSFDDSSHLTEQICECLGWFSPNDFYSYVLSHEDAFPSRFKDACKLRSRNHAIFYRFSTDSYKDVQNYFDEHMPMTNYLHGKTVCGVPEGERGETNPLIQIRDAFFSRFCNQVMFSNRIDINDLLPGKIAYHTYFDNIANHHDFIHLVEERHSWSRLSRFLALK